MKAAQPTSSKATVAGVFRLSPNSPVVSGSSPPHLTPQPSPAARPQARSFEILFVSFVPAMLADQRHEADGAKAVLLEPGHTKTCHLEQALLVRGVANGITSRPPMAS